MSEKIAIITDSTCDLTAPLRQAAGIHMVPLSVFFDEHEYLDNVDLLPDDFYAKLQSSAEMPTTAQPAPGKFLLLFQELLRQGFTHALCIHISRKFSGTVQAASVAAAMVSQLTIRCLDSKTTCWALGSLVEYAAALVRQGLDFAGIVQRVEEQIPKTAMFFSVDSLDALERGGRIGKARALVGKVLGIRPIFSMRLAQGEIEVVKKATSTEAANRMIAELTVDHFKKNGVLQRMIIMTGSMPQYGEQLRRQLLATGVDFGEIGNGQIGAVIGTHLGPTGWGLAIC